MIGLVGVSIGIVLGQAITGLCPGAFYQFPDDPIRPGYHH